MRSICAVACCALGFAAASAHAQESTEYRDAVRAVHVWLDAQRDFDRLVGMSAGIVHGSRLIWSQGYGSLDAAGTVATKPDTLYSVCSISKLFSAIAAMQLVEAGKLRLDDELSKLLPNVNVPSSPIGGGPITLRGILTHSSGLPGEAGSASFEAPDFKFPTRSELRRQLVDLSSLQPANERYRYSNFAMALLADVIEVASGQRYEDYLEQNVLLPLGLTDTRPRLPVELLGQRLAFGYGAIQRDGTRPLFKPFDVGGYVSAAGLTSTVPDLAKFATWQFRLLKSGAQEVVRASTLQEMQRVQWTDPDGRLTMGLGFQVAFSGANRVVSHSGACPGYLSAITLQPKDELAVIVLTNNEVAIGDYTRPIRQLLEKGRNLPAPAASGPTLSAYVGLYSRRNRGVEEAILPWGRGLAKLRLPSRDPASDLVVLVPTGGDVFRQLRNDGTQGEEITFVRNSEGKVRGYLQSSHMSPRVRDLPPTR